MGTGICSGDDRAIKAANEAISSPLLEEITIDGATGIIVNITGDKSLTTHEANEAMTLIMEAADEEAEIIFGTVIDESLNDSVKITVVATGLADQEKAQEPVAGKEHTATVAIPPESPIMEPELHCKNEEEIGDQTLREIEGHVESAIATSDELHDKHSMLSLKIKEAATRRELPSDPGEGNPMAPDLYEGATAREGATPGGRAQSIAERLGFINFNEDAFDAPSYSRKDQ